MNECAQHVWSKLGEWCRMCLNCGMITDRIGTQNADVAQKLHSAIEKLPPLKPDDEVV